MSFNLTIIGAGSLTFARTLFSDIMHVPELRGLEVAFTDINQQNLDMVTRLCQRDLEANGIPTKIQSTLDRREALRGARYIVNCVRIGGLEAFEKAADGKATKLIIPSEIQGVAGLAGAVAEIVKDEKKAD